MLMATSTFNENKQCKGRCVYMENKDITIECKLSYQVTSILEIQIGSHCRKCGKITDIGDYLDIHFPYYSDHNECEKCYNS